MNLLSVDMEVTLIIKYLHLFCEIYFRKIPRVLIYSGFILFFQKYKFNLINIFIWSEIYFALFTAKFCLSKPPIL